ncbi:MAG: tRNA dihydrouridine synthase DusB [Rikenellaceae bacterium]|jgi:nifR3 family TIM-barrel protein|nr:tRNA dihydrouridine synthase DusB [Rikenellaceae bacterium]
MKIGNIDLGPKPLLLAPMEDVTDLSFRRICKEQGADMVYTEFVPSEGLVRDASKAIAKMHTIEEEAPVGIQIYGHIPENMVDAAKMADRAAELAGGHGADLIDINFGCPVTKIAGRGAGSGMMRYPDKMVAISKAVVEAVPDKPVTVKTRLGWDENSKIIVELAERLQDAGIQAITIHGRTRCQMYKGEADWSLIGEVKRNPRMHIPIIGNGDIVDGLSAKAAFDNYGVDGIMLGRATFGHPWIFREIKYFLDKGELMPEPSVVEKVALAKRHLGFSLEVKGEPRGIYEMRRHLSCYFKALPDFRETRIRMVTTLDRAELFGILDEIAERWGAL